ncbi:hypothetical protein [Staphylococcus epidermidis]|uniref:hypothetical protein n=1 Tax=Staphylococcus epidermidis TaxID=1282 RepID=UPI0037DA04E1
MRGFIGMMIGLFICAFERGEEVGIGMEVRGYDIKMKGRRYRLLDWEYKETLRVLVLIPMGTILFTLKF